MLDRMTAACARSSQAKTAADERKRKADMILQNLKEAKRLTSSVMASNGIHFLRDPIFLEAYHEKRREANEKFEKNLNAKRPMRQRRLKDSRGCERSMGMRALTCLQISARMSAQLTCNTRSSQTKTRGCQMTCRNDGLGMWRG